MNEFENNAYFWQKVDTLYSYGDFKVTNKKGTVHRNYPSLRYPVDFGYVKTIAGDGERPMEVFKSTGRNRIEAIAICADIINKSFEVKALVGLSEEEIMEVLHFLNCTDLQKSVLIRRGKNIPAWSETE
ncbi:MAG: Inorganic pyrophosphatase [Erysipelotrichaceae bacterium]|nr:Inorganic pyrophosphatase [Erysipelotrichaceae bacterium]